VQRAGLSVLSAVGLGELAPATEEAYVETAVRLASDLPALAELRRTLRARVAASPLCDGPGLASALESAYGGMWRTWCSNHIHCPFST
jgi:protein O-GlcNAc transferase